MKRTYLLYIKTALAVLVMTGMQPQIFSADYFGKVTNVAKDVGSGAVNLAGKGISSGTIACCNFIKRYPKTFVTFGLLTAAIHAAAFYQFGEAIPQIGWNALLSGFGWRQKPADRVLPLMEGVLKEYAEVISAVQALEKERDTLIEAAKTKATQEISKDTVRTLLASQRATTSLPDSAKILAEESFDFANGHQKACEKLAQKYGLDTTAHAREEIPLWIPEWFTKTQNTVRWMFWKSSKNPIKGYGMPENVAQAMALCARHANALKLGTAATSGDSLSEYHASLKIVLAYYKSLLEKYKIRLAKMSFSIDVLSLFGGFTKKEKESQSPVEKITIDVETNRNGAMIVNHLGQRYLMLSESQAQALTGIPQQHLSLPAPETNLQANSMVNPTTGDGLNQLD